MEYISFSRLFMAVSLILIYVIQKLFGLAHQASPVNLRPLHDDMDVRHLAFEDQLQFIDSDDRKANEKLLDDIQLGSVSVSYLSVSVLLFELNERQGCLGAANYSVIRTFSAVNVGQMVLQVRGFKIGSPSSASDILRGKLYNIAKSQAHQQHQHLHHHNHQAEINNKHRPQQQQQQLNIDRHKNRNPESVCYGYGFTIYDCEPFDLKPNHEHKIRIGFNPDFTLTKTIVSLTILTNSDEEFKFALVASIPRSLLATCNRSLPRPDWEPTMHLILAIGMIIMIMVSILIAYMEAMLYLRSQQTSAAQSNGNQTSTQGNHHSGGNSKDCERNNFLNHSDACSKDRNNGSAHGAASISASIPSQQSSLPYNILNNTIGKNNNLNTNSNFSNSLNLNGKSTSNKANNNAQKRRKNSSSASSEKVPMNNKSTGSTSNDKKSSSPYAPIFQNLTNVIASPPPPLPTFDTEPDSLEFKKLKGKKSSKKSNSLSGSIAGGDDVGNPSSLQQGNIGSGSTQVSKQRTNGKANNFKMNGSCSTSSERYDVDQAQLDRASPSTTQDSKSNLKDAFGASEVSCLSNPKLYNGVKADQSQIKDQPTVMPIQPPSSLSSTPSSSSSAASSSSTTSTKSSSTSSSSSASSSPPLSTTSYGEYSLLGPGATFELPCLRVRSAQT